MKPWVWNRQSDFVHAPATDPKQVDIERAGTPALAPLSACQALYFERPSQELGRRIGRRKPYRRVQKMRLRGPNRRGFVHGRQGNNLGNLAEPPDGEFEPRRAVT